METNSSFNRLRELRGSGYEIVDGEPDIIGWSIRDSSDRKLGVVHDLLFEPEEQKVRYIVAHLKDNDFDLDRRKVLIPIGVAQLHENADNVILNAIQPWQIRALPTYDKHMADQDEQDIYTIFSTTDSTLATTTPQGQQNMYSHKNYNYDNLFQRRRKDKPKPNESKAAFLIRQRHMDEQDNLPSRDARYQESQYAQERNEVPVGHQRNSDLDNDRSRDDSIKRERLIGKIKDMKDDLNEIERELRNNNREL